MCVYVCAYACARVRTSTNHNCVFRLLVVCQHTVAIPTHQVWITHGVCSRHHDHATTREPGHMTSDVSKVGGATRLFGDLDMGVSGVYRDVGLVEDVCGCRGGWVERVP